MVDHKGGEGYITGQREVLAWSTVTEESISQGALDLGWLFRGVQGTAHAFDSCTAQSLAAVVPCGRGQFLVEARAVSPVTDTPSTWGTNL